MAYLITLNDKNSWLVNNQYNDWFMTRITKFIEDKNLIEFIEVSTYINGIDFQSDYGIDNKYRDQYLELLKIEVPKIIQNEDHKIIEHLRELELILNKV